MGRGYVGQGHSSPAGGSWALCILLGARIGGMCMSEPGYGTDVLGMKTTATRDGDSCALIRLLEKILRTSLCAATAYPLLRGSSAQVCGLRREMCAVTAAT